MSRILATLPLLLLVAGQALAQVTPDEGTTDVPTSPEVATPTLAPMMAPAPTQVAPTQVAPTQVAPTRPLVIPSSPTTMRSRPPTQYYGGYERPRDAVHRIAALKASQRRERIAARKAMGYSPLRPPTSPVPIMAGYSPYSNNSAPPTHPLNHRRPTVRDNRPLKGQRTCGS